MTPFPIKYPREAILLPVADLVFGDRVRTVYPNMDELATSIRANGLIHPPTVTFNNTLIAGGRRCRAMIDILKLTHIPVVYFETLSESELRILEDEENIQRSTPPWTDRMVSFYRVHTARKLEAARNSAPTWTIKDTGRILNQSYTTVNYALQLYSYISKGDKEIVEAEGYFAALQILAKRRELEISRALNATAASPVQAPKALPITISRLDTNQGGEFSTPQDYGFGLGNTAQAPGAVAGTPSEAPIGPTFDLGTSLICGDSIVWMINHPASVDHIITDIPYGIDMANLQQTNTGMDVSTTAVEHDVKDNLELFETLFPAMYTTLKEKGFAILWCDFQHWSLLRDLAEQAGFSTQRWPLIWQKSSNCLNQAAQYNFTKTNEVALVCRKGGAVLITPQQSNLIVLANDAPKLFGHPFAKPVALWNWLYSAVSFRGQTVLDPFAGSGSATVAAYQFGLIPIACELNQDNHTRLYTNVKSHLLSTNPNATFI